MILAGDIGGTKTVLGLYERSGGTLKQVREGVFPSQKHATFDEILHEFFAEIPGGKPAIAAGCFGVAGAVIDGKCKTTNLPWMLDEVELAKTIGAPRAKLLNDLEAAAYGMLHLDPEELHVINPGATPRRKGNVAVIAAGTGLGEAMLYWDGDSHNPIASEGGHSSFAPQDEEQDALLKFLRAKFQGHVSYERVLSGPGFFNIYEFLRSISLEPEPAWLTEQMTATDPSAAVSQAGLAGTDPVCVRTVELFASIYGAEAANLALKCVAVGGVYIGGGIAPKMLKVIEDGHFMAGFTAKGRFKGLLESFPVAVALNARAPLIGSAHYAARIAP